MKVADTAMKTVGVAVTAGVALSALKITERMCNNATRCRVSHSRPKRRRR